MYGWNECPQGHEFPRLLRSSITLSNTQVACSIKDTKRSDIYGKPTIEKMEYSNK